MNLEAISTEDCACTQMVESFSQPPQYQKPQYLADFGILVGGIIIYSIAKKVYEKIKKLSSDNFKRISML